MRYPKKMTIHEPTDGAVTEFFRLRLVSRLCSVEAVEEWATERVGSEEAPSYELCELATATTADRAVVLDCLRRLPRNEADFDQAWAMYCRSLHASLLAGRHTTEEAVYALYGLDRIHELPARLEVPVTILEDSFSLARDNIHGTLDDVKAEAAHLLSLYFDDETPNEPGITRRG